MACLPCLDPPQIETPNTDAPAANPQFGLGASTVVSIDTDKYVWVYIALDGTYTAQVFTVDSNGVFTWGAVYNFIDASIDLHQDNILHIAYVDTDKFAIYHDATYKYADPSFSYYMYVTVCTVSGVTISSHTNNLVMTDHEANQYNTGITGGIWYHRYGDIWSDGGTNIYLTTMFKPLAGDCSTTGTYELVTLAGSLSGEAITWATTTCTNGGTNNVRDWQVIESTVGTTTGAIEVIDNDGGTYAVMIHDDDGDDDLNVRAFNSGSYGSEVTLPSSSTASGVYSEFMLLRLSDTLSVLVANWGAASDTVHLWALSRSGTTMTAGTRHTLNTDDYASEVARLSDTEFILVGYVADDCDCHASWLFSVAGTTLSVDNNYDYWYNDLSNHALTLVPDAGSGTHILATARRNYNQDRNWPGVYIDATFTYSGFLTENTGYWGRP